MFYLLQLSGAPIFSNLQCKLFENTFKMKCAVKGCLNIKSKNSEKYFFWGPRPGEKREEWMKAIARKFGENSHFILCENHFDVSLIL